jgi:alkylated DNA repair dioxygenase AlkB
VSRNIHREKTMTQETNRIKELEVLKPKEEIMTEPFINSPFTYEEDFYTREEAAELLDACAKLPFERQKTRWGLEKRYAVIAYGDGGGRPYNAEVRPLSEAPDAIKKLLAKLSAYSGKNVNYASAVRYVDGTDYMGWHQHREDRGHDATVWIVSTGAERLFGLRDIGTKHVFKFTIKPGSLITLPSDANDTHEHAVLRMPGCKSVRYAVNCKAISPRKPQVYDCHAGKEYPADAVYVGREVRDRKGNLIREASPFGNPHLPPDEFRAYALAKMKDAAFAAQVMALKGKDLLCWCRPHEADQCHARVWLELANNPKGAASIAEDAKAKTTESHPIATPPNKTSIPARKTRVRKPFEHVPFFLTEEEADELYSMLMKLDFWIDNGDGSAQLNFGYSYSRGGPAKGEIPDIPDFLRKHTDRISLYTKYPVNFVQVHRFEPEHPVLPHCDPRGMCVPMVTVGQERTFQVGDDGTSKPPRGKQKNRKVEDHFPEVRILMRHGDLLVFTGNKVMHSMYPASKDEQFSPNGYDYRISILFRYTTKAMRQFGVGMCNRHGHEKQYRDATEARRRLLLGAHFDHQGEHHDLSNRRRRKAR